MTAPPFEQTVPTKGWLRRLDDLGSGDVAFAGGKGANLGELRHARVPVPDGFVIGAPAYAAYCDTSGLRDRIRERLAGLDVEDSAVLADASADVRHMILTTPFPVSSSARSASLTPRC